MADSHAYVWRSLFPESPCRRPCHRSKQAACRDGAQIYVYGGRDGHQTLQDFWRYDVQTNIWTRLECGGDSPPPLHEHTMVAQRGCLFVFGGELGYGSCGETPLWVYSLAKQTWEKPVIESEVVTPTGRRGHTAVVWCGGMHVYGGYVDLKGSSNELWTLDFETRWWHLSVDAQGENSPSPRHWHSAVIHEGNMWVYGGLNNLQPLRDLWKWNFESRQWTRIRGRQSPGFLHGHSAVRVANSMMIFGGEDSEGEYRNELWKFNFGSTSWHTATPNRRITPTSCTRHVLLSIPSNHIIDNSYLSTLRDNQRPLSAPTQAHNERGPDRVGAETPVRLLMDRFVVRPHSSPPVIGSERRRRDLPIHRFANRVHPSADDDVDPLASAKKTLFISDQDEEGDAEEVTEDGNLVTMETQENAKMCTQGDGEKTENGRWAVAMRADQMKDRIQGDKERTGHRHWAITSAISSEDVDQVEEKETSKLIINEESPLHQHHTDKRWAYQDETTVSTHPVNLQQQNGEWVLEDVLSEPSSPVSVKRVPSNTGYVSSAMSKSGPVVPHASAIQDCITLDYIEPDYMCNNRVEADQSCSRLLKNDTSILNTGLNVQVDTGCSFHRADVSSRSFDNDANVECNRGSYYDTEQCLYSEFPSVLEPEERVTVSATASQMSKMSNAKDVKYVRPLDVGSSESNVKVTDKLQLLPSDEKSVVTFVNLGFTSSHDDLQHAEYPQGRDVQVHCSRPSKKVESRSVDQSDSVHVPNDQSSVTLYPEKGHFPMYHSDAFHQSKPPALLVNHAVDQSPALYQSVNPSQPLMNHTEHQMSHLKRTPYQRVIQVKPTNHRVCHITVEETSQPSDQSGPTFHQLQQSQRPTGYRESSSKDSRPRLHARSQTLNNLPGRNPTDVQRPQRLHLSQLSSGQHRELLLKDSQEEEDVWVWPVFLFLMGGEETGSCSLHQNNSPMSVWKCCIVRGKLSDSEVQHMLSQY
ncbi:uncharacterized protein LOC110979356 [Acanthaster planci]|uniref:Uncharacterized protein LOC110979356 n=1 Tax=Acanthaster planci TaxID=133434 RepID=A0A8B7YBZ8_ACAPL|nr:uncharacterized protein LOC110979356 [Acanthaster planci]XP_022090769.1 uncharacterized protein LOC110979356 [Acanthaster planci]